MKALVSMSITGLVFTVFCAICENFFSVRPKRPTSRTQPNPTNYHRPAHASNPKGRLYPTYLDQPELEFGALSCCGRAL